MKRNAKEPSKVAVFIGTRPEAIKMAPIVRCLNAHDKFAPIVISTGQHREMLQQVIDIFDIPVSVDLDVMTANQTLASLTARVIEQAFDTLGQVKPEITLVQGDTTTVLGASLASFYLNIPIGHVEAGLRTGNLRAPFPEEANRVLAGRLASLHFAPTTTAERALLNEGVAQNTIFVTGNTVTDALRIETERQAALDRPAVPAEIGERPFVLITGHRRENFGDGFEQICDALATLAERFPSHDFVYPVHLNPNVHDAVHTRLANTENIKLLEPQPYDAFVALLARCTLVLTDSGGVQEEAPSLGKPVLVMRETTERQEGVEAGTVRLVGTDQKRIVSEATALLSDQAAYERMARANNPYGDGYAADKIVAALEQRLQA